MSAESTGDSTRTTLSAEDERLLEPFVRAWVVTNERGMLTHLRDVVEKIVDSRLQQANGESAKFRRAYEDMRSECAQKAVGKDSAGARVEAAEAKLVAAELLADEWEAAEHADAWPEDALPRIAYIALARELRAVLYGNANEATESCR